MENQFKHLNEDVMEQTPFGYMPAVPIPFYNGRLWGRKTRECTACHFKFKTDAEYGLHYRTAQLGELNQAMSESRDLLGEYAKFWRRAAFIYREGTKAEVKQMEQMFDAAGWGNGVDLEQMHKLNDTMLAQWAPVRDRYKSEQKLEKKTDIGEVEDQTADEAKGDFADPFTVVNSRGETYYLNMKYATLRAGKKTAIWYFTRKFMPETAQRKLPDGYEVYESVNKQMRVKRSDTK